LDNSTKEHINRLRRSTENEMYFALKSLLEIRLETVKNQMIDSTTTAEYNILKGRARELRELLLDLTRKPVNTNYKTGAFN
jgi:hypothetical protein